MVARPARLAGAGRPAGGRRQVRGLLRVRRAVHPAAVAPDPGPAARGEGGGPRPGTGPGGGDPGGRQRVQRLRDAGRGALRRRRPGPAGGPLARRHGPLVVADPHPGPSRRGPADAAVAGGRGGRGRRVRRQPARPAAGRARGGPDHDGPGSRLPDRGEGRGGGRDGQGGRDRDDLPARDEARARGRAAAGRRAARGGLPDVDRGPRPAGRGPPGRADRHRQRHRLAGDRPAGRRPDAGAPGPGAHQGRGLRGGGLGLLGLRVRLPGAARHGRVAARRGVHRPPPAGSRWPSSSRSTRSPSGSASTSTTCPRRSCPARWTRWSRTA